ncbi:hypothetical protein [Methylacidimicrobium sp. AP8]|uniref:hypothetical protein n=1 Tax=Methylacidimicrobium sp. AP8 TaxID=2730359 RepID=UPI0019216D8D|nr:hypothetical protein [Methylacidimicrobium sp. AP8]
MVPVDYRRATAEHKRETLPTARQPRRSARVDACTLRRSPLWWLQKQTAAVAQW